jgi:putative flippase GtrA
MFTKLFRYFLTAGVAAVVDLFGFWWLFHLGIGVVPAAMTSWVVAAIVNFLLTSHFVFNQRRSIDREAKFIAGALIGFGLNVCITTFFSNYLGVYPPISKLSGISGAFLFNFGINLLWVFR